MSLQLIQHYYTKVEKIIQYGGSRNESAPYPLQQIETPPTPRQRGENLLLPPASGGIEGGRPKPRLKADKPGGRLEIDDATVLTGVPALAWNYKLGNRSTLDWVLEYHKERAPKDPTIRDKFNTYRLADHKEAVIDLLQRVCAVSVETMQIIAEMETRQTAGLA